MTGSPKLHNLQEIDAKRPATWIQPLLGKTHITLRNPLYATKRNSGNS